MPVHPREFSEATIDLAAGTCRPGRLTRERDDRAGIGNWHTADAITEVA